jgi:hypothetical protein
MEMKKRISELLSEIGNTVTLVAASKTRSAEEVEKAFNFGIKNMGENYIKEGIEKIEKLKDNKEIIWHFIGHLQKNKVKKAVKYFNVIQTVDSYKLAELINKEAEKIGKKMEIMIEINIAKEEQKSGIMPEQVENLAEKIIELPNLKLIGLMTMGPVVDNVEDIRPFFKKAKLIYDELKNKVKSLQYLSMGMSDSYKIAIEEGSNMVRIGTKIFGPRIYTNN